jgi:hypothetical protein
MEYNAPWDQLPSNPNAPYIDGNPTAGIQGSIVPAHALEYDQREVVEVISRANLRGYHDFSGAACAPPSNSDLMQLRKALEGFLNALPNWYIDTDVTFTVHGTGANFPDLNQALWYLSKYVITQHGHVTLLIQTGKWSYGNAIINLTHPNGDRILITGAALKRSPSIADFPVTGYTPVARSNDRTVALNNMRACYNSELTFTGGGGITNHVNGFTITQLLITGDRGGGTLGIFNSSGFVFVHDCSIAVGDYGFTSTGGCMYIAGFNSCSGNTGSGFGATNGLMWHGGTMVATSNDYGAFVVGYSSIISGNAIGIGCGNGGSSGCTFASLEMAAGSQFNTNDANGVFVDQGQFQVLGGAGGTQFYGNSQAGLYVTMGSTAQGPASNFAGNLSGYAIMCGQYCTVYFPGSSGVIGYSYPAANNWSSAGLIVV